MNSILTSIKKMLGIEELYDHFDQDIIISINSIFATLNQIGVGPDITFSITDKEAIWTDFLGEDTTLESVKTYIYLRVRLLFDPPTSAFVLDAMERQIKEFEWRLYVQAEKGIIDPVEGGTIYGWEYE